MTVVEGGANFIFMNAAQTAAFRAFLSTLTSAQRIAMMDVMSSYIEDATESIEAEEIEEPAEHQFIIGVNSELLYTFAVDGA